MNKVLRMSLLALATVALMGSCKKKSNGEPDPNGTQVTPLALTPAVPLPPAPTVGVKTDPNTTPVDGTKAIELQLASGATHFELAGLEGKDVTIEGATLSDGSAFAQWGFVSRTPTQKAFTAAAGAKVVIKGNITALAITAGKFTMINLSKAPTTFHTFAFYEAGDAGSISTAGIDFGDITTLENLYLGFNYNHRKVGPSIEAQMDFSKLINLKHIELHRFNDDTRLPKFSTKYAYLRNLLLSETSVATMPDFIGTNYPSLELMILTGAQFQSKGEFKLGGLQNFKTFSASRTHLPALIDMNNTPKLATFSVRECLFYPRGVEKVFNFLATPALTLDKIVLQDSGILKKNNLNVTAHQGWTILAQ